MKIYTKTGDHGETSLFGGERVPKNHTRIEAYGTVDELNCLLGLARTADPAPAVERILNRLQNELFQLGTDLATPPGKNRKVDRISAVQVNQLESDIDSMEDQLSPLTHFILPGGSVGSSYLHHARTVCRRAERACITSRQTETISDEVIIYLNRLSDLLFTMARHQNRFQNISDTTWDSKMSPK